MPINYFELCQYHSSQDRFGLCDDPPPESNPAYIDETNNEKWIGIVNNPENKHVQFNAIDNCIDIRRPDNTMDSRCDGVLSYNSSIIFVELKERAGGKWLKKGREQLTATINRFKQESDMKEFDSVQGYVCNSLRPLSSKGQFESIQRFKDDTGYLLFGKQEIDLK